MTRKLLILVFLLMASASTMPQNASDPNEGSRISFDPIEGAATISWWGRAGMFYYLQYSEDLVTWRYYGSLVLGRDAIASFNAGTGGPRFFIKLEPHPTNTDSDGDGLTDVDEVTRYNTDPRNRDTDGDGLTDGYEVNTSHTNPIASDSDGDGLTDAQEVALGTNPNVKDTDGDGAWDGADQYPLDIRRLRDIPVVHYVAIDISTPIIGDKPVWDIALDDSNQVAFGYNDPAPYDFTHVVRWKDGIQNGSIDYPVIIPPRDPFNNPIGIFPERVIASGAIAGTGVNNGEDGQIADILPFTMGPTGTVPTWQLPGDFDPTEIQGYRYYEFRLEDFRNSGVVWGTLTKEPYDSDFAYIYDFIDGSRATGFAVRLLNDAGMAAGFTSTSSVSVLSAGGTESVFPTDSSTQTFALGGVPLAGGGSGYSVFGYSPLLAGFTTLEALPDLPPGAPHPFLKITGNGPIDFYSVLGDFNEQLVFATDAAAAINNQGDILVRAFTLPSDNPLRTAPYSREGYFLWNRSSGSVQELAIPYQLLQGDLSYSLKDLQLNKDHLIVAIQERDAQGNDLPNPRAILGVPVEMRITDRDDPTKKWADNAIADGPVYAGKSTGDMVSWKLGGTDNWTGVTFTWSAVGPGTYSGPSGVGKNEWRIADGDADTQHDWLNWKPGTYKIKCMVTYPNGVSSTGEFEQEVGARTIDVVVIGWIDRAGVPLDATGMPSDITSYYPPDGNFSSTLQRYATAGHFGLVSTGATIRPGPAVGMNAAEKTYMLHWLFKYSGNNAPPNSFATEAMLNQFRDEATNYKLYNRFQIKFLLSDDGTRFKENPTILKDKTSPTRIGTTIDPILLKRHPGRKQEAEGKRQIKQNKVYHQTNDGSPEAVAVNVFNTLESPLKWNDIGSTISFGVEFGLAYRVLQQVYPTYYIYERIEDGSFYLYQVVPQAATPEGNFNSNPYYPPASRGPAPFIIPP